MKHEAPKFVERTMRGNSGQVLEVDSVQQRRPVNSAVDCKGSEFDCYYGGDDL